MDVAIEVRDDSLKTVDITIWGGQAITFNFSAVNPGVGDAAILTLARSDQDEPLETLTEADGVFELSADALEALIPEGENGRFWIWTGSGEDINPRANGSIYHRYAIAPVGPEDGDASTTPGVGAAEAEGLAPAVSADASASVTPGVGDATAEGVAPDASASASAATGIGEATAEGSAPTASGAPVASDDTATVVQGAAVNIDVLANDTGNNLTIVLGDEPAAAYATILTSDGSVIADAPAERVGELIPNGREYIRYDTAA